MANPYVMATTLTMVVLTTLAVGGTRPRSHWNRFINALDARDSKTATDALEALNLDEEPADRMRFVLKILPLSPAGEAKDLAHRAIKLADTDASYGLALVTFLHREGHQLPLDMAVEMCKRAVVALERVYANVSPRHNLHSEDVLAPYLVYAYDQADSLGVSMGQPYRKDATDKALKGRRWWSIRYNEICEDWVRGHVAAAGVVVRVREIREILNKQRPESALFLSQLRDGLLSDLEIGDFKNVPEDKKAELRQVVK